MQDASDRSGGDRRPLHGGHYGAERGCVHAPQEHQEEESAATLPGDRGDVLPSALVQKGSSCATQTTITNKTNNRINQMSNY